MTPNKKRNQFIIAHGKTSSTIYKILVRNTPETKQNTLFRKDFTFTVEETAAEPGDHQQRVLVVWLTCMTMAVKAKAKDEEGKSTKRQWNKHIGVVVIMLPVQPNQVLRLPSSYTGHAVRDDNEVLDLVDGVEAVGHESEVRVLLVVSPCYDKPPTQTKLYALLRPENVQATRSAISPNFGTFGKAAEPRQRNWNSLLRKLVIKQNEGDVVAPELTTYGTPRDELVAMVGTTVSSANGCPGVDECFEY
ncbi:hypothetical protein J1614_010738 [Plenodomus biglobosus]|nr:hypothetical protein J1614_010738 [Plenodomus biglobosus]